MGRCVADAILGRPSEIDLAAFDPARFVPRKVAA
jgi:glycine/D-amino acid oxidase-like deaminating enzyme